MNRVRSLFGLGKRRASSADRDPGSPQQVARQFTIAGDKARDRGEWATAAAHYAQSLSVFEQNAPIHVQHGHALKESGRPQEAAAAYRQAALINPDNPDPWMQMAHVLKGAGDIQGAAKAFREVLLRDPSATGARDELISMGARDHVPAALIGQAAAAVESARLTHLLTTAGRGLANLVTVTTFPQGDHNAFRAQYPIQAPPAGYSGPLRVRISCADATPALLRATLTSLIDQRHQDWTAHVVAAGDLADHSVASFANVDPRIRFAPLVARDKTPVVMVTAGDVLDREALGWLAYALARTSAAAVYSDHDHYSPDWRAGQVRHSPQLQPMFDADGMRGSSSPPCLAIFADGKVAADATDVISALETASAKGPVAHLPRLLVSRSVETAAPPKNRPAEPHALAADAASILVVIPTRDEAEMLERCIRSLIAKASQPDRIRILIVDNRSGQPETAATLSRLTNEGAIQTLALDEPFNWPRCNNRAVQGRDEDILVFANNDMEMLSTGWDDDLRGHLGRPEVGVIGARLLYPDGGVQHAGILLGTWEGRPSHDGLWVGNEDEGPLQRWVTPHAAAAVTGAFMACRRETFESVGGFDERFAIAYNDIDFCLKVREGGLKVVYCPQIELTHYESRTRGHNNSPEKVAWDDAELTDMHQRWGRWLFHDPSYNPQWAMAVNRPYDGIHDLALSRVLDHLDASAVPNPWAIVRDLDAGSPSRAAT